MSEGVATRLEELEELYRDLPVALAVVDRELRYVRMNAAYARVLGGEVQTLLGHSMQETLHESVRDGAVAVARRVFETGQPVLEFEASRDVPIPEDRRAWLVNCHPIKRGGETVAVAAVLQNVTSVRRAQEAAVERLNELESIYRNAPVGLGFVDRSLRYLRVNQRLADMNGVSIDEMVGRTYRDLSPETADAAEPLLRSLMDRGEPVRAMEMRSRPPADPDMEHVYLMSMDPVPDPYGGMLGWVFAIEDLTELRRAEETAAQRLEELETLYASTPVGLCHMDAELRIVHLNPGFAELSSMPLEQQVGALAEEVLRDEIARQLLPELRYVARTGAPSGEIEIRGRLPRSGNREYTWITRTHPLRGRDGAISGVITVLQDMSAFADRRRRIEAVRDRLSEAQHVSRMGSWEWNLLEDEVWWSSGLYAVFGENASYEPSYDRFFEHVHPADRQKVREQLEQTLADDQPIHMTFRIIRPDGSERTLFSAARLERTDGGIPSRLVGTAQDVTERPASADGDKPGARRWSAT